MTARQPILSSSATRFNIRDHQIRGPAKCFQGLEGLIAVARFMNTNVLCLQNLSEERTDVLLIINHQNRTIRDV